MSMKPRGPSEDAAKKHEDEALDEALEDSFPASDPPAATDPSHREKLAPEKSPKPV
jgi:hypothetical protein